MDGNGRTGPEAAQVPTWEEVARDYGRFLYTVGYRLTGNHEETQDLVQEVLLRVRRGLATYQPGSMEGWLSRIATNAFLDDVRRKKRRPVEALPEDAERVLPGALPADEALDAANLPEADKSKMDFGSGGNTEKKAWRDIWSAGQGVGNIHEVLPTRELVARMVREYEDTRRRLCG